MSPHRWIDIVLAIVHMCPVWIAANRSINISSAFLALSSPSSPKERWSCLIKDMSYPYENNAILIWAWEQKL